MVMGLALREGGGGILGIGAKRLVLQCAGAQHLG